MNFDPKAVRRALMIAKDLAVKIDPGFAVHNLPMPPQGVPLERAEGGIVEEEAEPITWKSPQWTPHPENDLLQPIGASKTVGNEKLLSQDDTFSHGVAETPWSDKKSYRYLYHDENKKPIGAMQIRTVGPRSKKAIIQNLYVAEDNRRQGIASKLLARAREDFDVKHSSNLTDEGRAFAKAVKSEGGAVNDHPDQGYAPKPAGVLDVDNPGGDWLKENREYSESRGYLPSGAPKSFGKTTAVWREPNSNNIAPVYLPVSMLSQLPGVMGEQRNVRSHDLDWLVDHMGKTGKLPKIDGREYKPFITVDHRGRPFVSEGNHRIMAAAKLGWDYLPVEVRYFNGAEDVDGPLHPDRIKAMQPPKKQIGGAVEDDDMPARKLNSMGMYSAAAEAARNLPQERGTLQQMLASLKGIKPDEINFSDVQNRLGDKPIVTKQELADYFSRNIPKLEVTSLDEDSSEAAKNRYTDIALTMGGKESNYAEDLIQYSEPFFLSMSPKPAALKAGKNAFYTEHYPEIPNILAHVRRSDREGPNGEKLLHLEELQSDWGQTGKKHGFENPVVPGTVIEDPDYPGTFRINWPNGRFSAGYRTREIAEGVAVEGAAARAKYTPLVPHVGTTNKWMDLALKRALNIAAKGNYDGIIWTPGDKQVERYKGIGEIGGGLKYLYDNIVPKQLLGLAKEHDPSAKVESLSAAHDPVVDGFPLMRISPKMRESIKKRGFKAFSTGGFAMPQPVDSDKTIRRALMIAKR